MFSEQFAGLALAEQQKQILATNHAAYGDYGVRLSPEDAEMIAQTGQKAVSAAGMVAVGGSIVPRLIRWFLPSGYLTGQNYALNVAELTEAFYRLRSELQDAGGHDPALTLSDNALLNYMFNIYTSPTCSGDAAEMTAQAENILLPVMRRLAAGRETERKQQTKRLSDQPENALLFADLIEQERAESSFEEEADEESYDYEYRSAMGKDCFGGSDPAYQEPEAYGTRDTYEDRLRRILNRNPAMLFPSRETEAEWADRAEHWEDEDAAAAKKEGAK